MDVKNGVPIETEFRGKSPVPNRSLGTRGSKAEAENCESAVGRGTFIEGNLVLTQEPLALTIAALC